MTRRSVLALAAAPAIFAQSSRAARGEKIIKDAVAALGGDKFLSMEDRVESGRAYSFYRERLSGLSKTKIYTRYLTRPQPPQAGFYGVRVRQTLGKNDETAVVFLEDDKGWDLTYRGARPIPLDDVKRFHENQLRNIFYILRMRLGEPGLILEHQGTEVTDNQPAEIVDITDADNRVVTVWFHQTTKLPIRQRAFRRQGGDRDEDLTDFAKYRDVGGGIHWPYTWLRTRNGEKLFELFSDSVAMNTGIGDELFAISADTKILKKK